MYYKNVHLFIDCVFTTLENSFTCEIILYENICSCKYTKSCCSKKYLHRTHEIFQLKIHCTRNNID